MTPKSRSRIILAVKAAVTLSLLAASLGQVNFGTLTERLRTADVGLLAASAVLLLLGGFAGAGSWLCILRVRLPTLSYRGVAACHWSGMFFNSFLPSNVGGDVVKGYIVARDQGQAGFVVTSLLLDRVINLGVLLCIGTLALLVQLERRLWALAFAALLALFLPVVPSAARRVLSRVRRLPRTGARGRIAALAEPVFELAAAPRLFYPTLLAAAGSQSLKIWHNAFVILALGLKIPTFCVWYVIPLFGLVSALPVSIGGLGLREMVAQGLSGPMRLDAAHLVALSLSGHLMVVLVNMLGALPFLFTAGARRGARRAGGRRARTG